MRDKRVDLRKGRYNRQGQGCTAGAYLGCFAGGSGLVLRGHHHADKLRKGDGRGRHAKVWPVGEVILRHLRRKGVD